ncbi:MAG: hypothetical protein UW24_C0002G0032 [Parcubacteria group bacterium GW2011_GWA2_44_12]|nr:MAG: hypothetical protein UW24_C0002G0032 [Parcubacteria group bacterium GW2011_GWA2_44_12]
MHSKFKIFQRIVLVFAALFLVALYFMFMFYKSLKRIEMEIRVKEKESIAKLDRSASREVVMTVLEKFESDFGHIAESIVKSGKELEFIQALEHVAENRDVAQKIEMSFDASSKSIKPGEIGKIPLVLNVTVPYREFLRYLSDLDRFQYYVVIKSITITRSSGTGPFAGAKRPLQSGEEVSAKIVVPQTQVNATLQGYFYWKNGI